MATVLVGVIALALLIFWCFCRRNRQRDVEYQPGTRRPDSRLDENNRRRIEDDADQNGAKGLKVIGLDVRKMNNAELEEQQCSNLATDDKQLVGEKQAVINNLYSQKISTVDLAVSAAAAEKMAVSLDDKARSKSRDSDVESRASRRDRIPETSTAASSSSRAGAESHMCRANRSDVKARSPRRPPPATNAKSLHYQNVPQSCDPATAAAHSELDLSDEDDVFDSSPRPVYLQSDCDCHSDSCRGNERTHRAERYARSSVEGFDCSESEEVAMLMGASAPSPQRRHHSRRHHRCSRQHSGRQRYDAASDSRRSQRRRCQRHPPTPHSACQGPGDAETDALVPTSGVGSRGPATSSGNDVVLPPYESIAANEDSRTASPLCECGHGRQSTPAGPANVASSYQQSPPPAYSRHYNRPTQTWQTTSAAATPPGPRQTSDLSYPLYNSGPQRPPAQPRQSGGNCRGPREAGGEYTNNERLPARGAHGARPLTASDSPTAELLTDMNLPHEAAV